MAYQRTIGTHNPGCIILLVDQSGSMVSALGGAADSRSEEAARSINACLMELCLACSNGNVFKDRLDVGIIGYGQEVGSILSGPLAGRELVGIRDIGFNPARVEYVMKKVSDGAGSLVEVDYEMPIWIEPKHGGGTPMDRAFEKARTWAEGWIQKNPRSFPPVVLNVTDGAPNDHDATRAAAQRLRAVKCEDGNVLLFNLHITGVTGRASALPTTRDQLPDQYAQFLFDISSVIPASLLFAAQQQGLEASEGARALAYNADVEYMVKLLRFGTVGTMAALGQADAPVPQPATSHGMSLLEA